MEERSLPARFSGLQHLVAEWALKTEKDRYVKLHATDLARLQPFYEAMVERLEEILDYLDQYEISTLPPDAAVLFDLTQTFAEVAHPVDLNWTDIDFPTAYSWEVLEFRTVSCSDEISNSMR